MFACVQAICAELGPQPSQASAGLQLQDATTPYKGHHPIHYRHESNTPVPVPGPPLLPPSGSMNLSNPPLAASVSTYAYQLAPAPTTGALAGGAGNGAVQSSAQIEVDTGLYQLSPASQGYSLGGLDSQSIPSILDPGCMPGPGCPRGRHVDETSVCTAAAIHKNNSEHNLNAALGAHGLFYTRKVDALAHCVPGEQARSASVAVNPQASSTSHHSALQSEQYSVLHAAQHGLETNLEKSVQHTEHLAAHSVRHSALLGSSSMQVLHAGDSVSMLYTLAAVPEGNQSDSDVTRTMSSTARIATPHNAADDSADTHPPSATPHSSGNHPVLWTSNGGLHPAVEQLPCLPSRQLPAAARQFPVLLGRCMVQARRAAWPLVAVDVVLLVLAALVVGTIQGADWGPTAVPRESLCHAYVPMCMCPYACVCHCACAHVPLFVQHLHMRVHVVRLLTEMKCPLRTMLLQLAGLVSKLCGWRLRRDCTDEA